MKVSEYRNLVRNKYHAKKVTSDGIMFDSRKEYRRWCTLHTAEHFGAITNLRRQVVFELQPGYVNNQGKKIRPITYIADFCYEQEGKKIVEDTKGFKTKEYQIKRKLFEYKYPAYTLVESSQINKRYFMYYKTSRIIIPTDIWLECTKKLSRTRLKTILDMAAKANQLDNWNRGDLTEGDVVFIPRDEYEKSLCESIRCENRKLFQRSAGGKKSS